MNRARTACGPQPPTRYTAGGWLNNRSAALGAARELRGSRRPPAADYLIAAAAAERGFGVLHLDTQYDTLAPVMGFVSVRLDRD